MIPLGCSTTKDYVHRFGRCAFTRYALYGFGGNARDLRRRFWRVIGKPFFEQFESAFCMHRRAVLHGNIQLDIKVCIRGVTDMLRI